MARDGEVKDLTAMAVASSVDSAVDNASAAAQTRGRQAVHAEPRGFALDEPAAAHPCREGGNQQHHRDRLCPGTHDERSMSSISSSKSPSRWVSSGERWNSGSQNCALKMPPERNASWFFNRPRCSFANCSFRFVRLAFWSAACFSAASSCVLRAFSVARCFATAGVSGAAPSAGAGPSTSSCPGSAHAAARDRSAASRHRCSAPASSRWFVQLLAVGRGRGLLLDAVEFGLHLLELRDGVVQRDGRDGRAPTPLGAEAAAGNADAVAIAANCSSAIRAIRRA